MTQDRAQIPACLARLLAAFEGHSTAEFNDVLDDVFSHSASLKLCHPFGELSGPDALFEATYDPLHTAMPDLERRDMIIVSGQDEDDRLWVGCMGQYVGTFMAPFLDIPPTGHFAHMRFHEFFRIEDDQIVEMQAIWDIPQMMMQANAWPLAPSLGVEICIPSPMTQDGLTAHDADQGAQSKAIVIDMLIHLSRHPREGGPEIMQSDRFWHPKMNWYGPAGIGTARGITGFRHWHQIPFLNALPNRQGGTKGSLPCHFFAAGDYVAVTGWPNMKMSMTGDGWLGLPPTGQDITMRSLDFWRVENGLIRENWVLVDLLDVYRQLGIDVFARLKEFNKARVFGAITPLTIEA